MFIKRTRGGSPKRPIYYLQLVQTYREDGKVKHKVIATLGREDELMQNGTIDSIMESISKYADRLIVLDKSKEAFERSYILGPILLLENIWKKLDMNNILMSISKNQKAEFDFVNAVKLMVYNRLIDPKSKLGINEWKKSVFTSDFDDIKLQHLYRSLDILEKNKTLVQKMLYNEQLSLFKDKINLVFYDLTTLYFESQEVDSDGLKRFGYSKDNKTDCVQITMGLVLNENNIPLGFDLFPGNTYEGNTVEDMIHKLKKTYDIEKIVVVADRGILNKKVISQIEESGYEYILASKLSSLPEAIQEEVFTDVGYEEVNPDLKMKELSFNNSRLIVFHSEKRSHRDKKQRDMVLSKLKKRLEKDKKTSISPSYKKYLRITDFSSEIDSDKVKDSEKRDGYFGFHCNNKDFSKLDILNSYRMLWQIEESFRCCKSYLDLRPIYHWTDRRITGHIMMCFISFYLLRIIQKLLSDNSIDLSPDKLFTSLSEIVCVEMKVSNKGHRDNVLYGRTSISGLNNHIFRSLEFPIPPFILKKY